MRQVVEISVVFVTVALATYFGFQPEYGATSSFWLIIGVPTLLAAAYSCVRLGLEGELTRLLSPAFGDITKGVVGAAALYAVALFGSRVVTPSGSPHEAWLIRLYLQIGDPASIRAHLGAVGFLILAIVSAEEIVWRGLVTRALEERIGSQRAWIYSALLFALAHAPSMIGLADPRVGPNPFLFLTALGGGLLWGGMAKYTGRLPASILAHAIFVWCAVVKLRLWGGPL